jgi:hypothetical protein
MAHEVVRSKLYLVAAVCVATVFLAWNALLVLGGWLPGYLRIALDLAVIVGLLTKFRYGKVLVQVWASLPLISLGLFLTSSLLRGRWSANPIEHVVGVALTLPLLLLANRAFGARND